MTAPLPTELFPQLASLSPTQLAWLSGYCWAMSNGSAAEAMPPVALAAAATPTAARQITILSASQTGNAKQVAQSLFDKLQATGRTVQLIDAADYKTKQLANEDILLLITSTQGEGGPPEEAIPLYQFLHGKKAPKLEALSFAVLGLGDSSYPHFCQAGRDFDHRLAELGGTRLADVGICDLDFQATAQAWVAQIIDTLPSETSTPTAAPTNPTPAAATPSPYTKNNPFQATLAVRQKITANEAEKDVEHIEIDLSGSGLQYQAGDALGVWPDNSPELVQEILKLTQLSGEETIQREDGSQTTIQTALTHERDITQITPQWLHAWAIASSSEALKRLIEDPAAQEAYLALTPPVGVIAEHPATINAQSLYELFRPQTPRLYSIASAQEEVGEEVHLTVGVQRFAHHGNTYTGAASGYLGERLAEDAPLRVFIEPNKHFKLPENPATPIIMIGAGTGIAPFRAFMQAREASEATGGNWLIFGNRKFTDDFLYQAEWLRYRKNGLLTRADLAWSRQGQHKEYVQHKIQAAAPDIWQWLQNGAHIYVCGDASRMAKDVEQALFNVICEQGKLNEDDAQEYLNELRQEKRYQRDVY